METCSSVGLFLSGYAREAVREVRGFNGTIQFCMKFEYFITRSRIIKEIRRFFDDRGYTEVHTPRLVGLPGQEPHLKPFWTTVDAPNASQQWNNGTMEQFPAALITSPEYAMKRLLAAGMDKIYDLGPCFRNNEPWDGTHDPEFLMLEWYRKDADIHSLMDETEEMIRSVIKAIPDTRYEIPDTFRRMTVVEAWKKYLDVNLIPLLSDREAMAKLAREYDQPVEDSDTWDDVYFKIFLSKIESKVAEEPTFLYRYPVSMAALAAPCADDPRFADRAEFYMGGLELANGFVELSDPVEQRKRFEEEQALRRSLGKDVWPIDEKFLADLPNMGSAVGMAFGVDRFVMLLTGAKSISDVIPFSARERLGG
jgi:lysyl-tRNA synthetase class 2